MRQQSLTDDAVLQRYVAQVTLVVGVDGERLVETPRERAVVEDHVRAVGHARAVLSAGAVVAHPDAQVTADDVARAGEAHAVAIDGDALTRCRLSGHVEVAGEDDARGDVDDARYVEHHDAVAL